VDGAGVRQAAGRQGSKWVSDCHGEKAGAANHLHHDTLTLQCK
jgi:hypothetical protein